MATATKTVTELPAWKALSAHFQKIDRLHLRELFAQDPKRGERLTVEAAGLYLDYSKNRITDETLACCCNWPNSPGSARGSMRCSEARRSTLPRSGPSCT